MQELFTYLALVFAVVYLIKKLFFTKNTAGCAHCPKVTGKKA